MSALAARGISKSFGRRVLDWAGSGHCAGELVAVGSEAQARPVCPAMAATRRLRPVPSQRLPGAMVSGARAVLEPAVTSTSIHLARPGTARVPRGHAPL